MSQHAFPFGSMEGDRTYTAEDFAAYFAAFIDNGILPKRAQELQVKAQPEGLTVVIKPGSIWIKGCCKTQSSDYLINLDVSDGVFPRIDRIVARWDFVARDIVFAVVSGTPAQNPAAPELTRDALLHELGIATIRVAKGAINISQSDITDTRMNSSLCGIAAGVINQIDATDLFVQYESAFSEFFSTMEGDTASWTQTKQADFETWYSGLQDLLSGDVATKLAGEITALSQEVTRRRKLVLTITISASASWPVLVTHSGIQSDSWIEIHPGSSATPTQLSMLKTASRFGITNQQNGSFALTCESPPKGEVCLSLVIQAAEYAQLGG